MKQVPRLTLAAMFLAIMMILGYVETVIFGYSSGLKIGLSNSVLLLSLYWLGLSTSFYLMLGKVLLTAMLFTNFQTMLFSLGGGLLSLCVMALMVLVVSGVSPVGAGVAGAVTHLIGQAIVGYLMGTLTGMLPSLPLLIGLSLVTGALTGTIARMMMHYLPYERRKALEKKTRTDVK